jgi:hypothetical protein
MSTTLARALVLATVLLPVIAAPAAAQRTISVGIAAGGSAVEGTGIAPSGALSVQYQSPIRAFSLRGEGTFASPNTTSRVSAFTLNGLLGPVPSHGVAPYVIAGFGTYLQPGLGAHLGVNAGLGLRTQIGSVMPFVELRTHAWSRPAAGPSRMTPLQIGVTF